MRPRSLPWGGHAAGPQNGFTDRAEIVDRTALVGGDADGHAKAGVETGPSWVRGLHVAATDAPVRDSQGVVAPAAPERKEVTCPQKPNRQP